VTGPYLFNWTGYAPKEAVVDHRIQVSCCAVFPTKKAFLEATDSSASRLRDYVSCWPIDRRSPAHEGQRLATENPGVVYWQDTLRNIPRDAPWLVHPAPERS
jgi:hypothetical protein